MAAVTSVEIEAELPGIEAHPHARAVLAPALRQVFLVHGEPLQSAALVAALRSAYQLQAQAPVLGQSFYTAAM